MRTSTPILILVLAAASSFGCQNASTQKKTGSYAAARRTHVGSNIPQPDNVDSTGSTFDDEQLRRMQQQQGSAQSNGPLAGGGGR